MFLIFWREELGLNSGLHACKVGTQCLSPTSNPFYCGFGNGVLRTICPGWPQITVLPISYYRNELLVPGSDLFFYATKIFSQYSGGRGRISNSGQPETVRPCVKNQSTSLPLAKNKSLRAILGPQHLMSLWV
jgi:hypothetical protein